MSDTRKEKSIALTKLNHCSLETRKRKLSTLQEQNHLQFKIIVKCFVSSSSPVFALPYPFDAFGWKSKARFAELLAPSSPPARLTPWLISYDFARRLCSYCMRACSQARCGWHNILRTMCVCLLLIGHSPEQHPILLFNILIFRLLPVTLSLSKLSLYLTIVQYLRAQIRFQGIY